MSTPVIHLLYNVQSNSIPRYSVSSSITSRVIVDITSRVRIRPSGNGILASLPKSGKARQVMLLAFKTATIVAEELYSRIQSTPLTANYSLWVSLLQNIEFLAVVNIEQNRVWCVVARPP